MLKQDIFPYRFALFANELFAQPEGAKGYLQVKKSGAEAPLIRSLGKQTDYAKLRDWRPFFMRRLPMKPSIPKPASIMA